MENKFSAVLLHSTVSWVKTMRNELGTDAGMKCFDVIRECYGDDLAGAVMFSLMGDNSGMILRGHAIPQPAYEKISIIKAIRAISRLGLKESKDLTEDMIDRHIEVTIPIHESNTISTDVYNINVKDSVNQLYKLGIIVK